MRNNFKGRKAWLEMEAFKQTNKLQKELYSKEPKSVTFCELTFFHADISQSEFEDSFQLASEWIRSVRKSMNNSEAVTLSDSLP